ncbi:YciI family protein [Streptomyces mexicanus]|uniref:Antibiotic biosynthesis monooxygenase n=1 Tax=Streptomyces mexicanus TaxID=178566 RepID=A0A7X1I3M6_9ACTN|nr:YciI family protein [Streptomyces mexicanus]MBC2867063.1 antibiotic biosynthesis monooxygenase [Streptomyces mexicanus]
MIHVLTLTYLKPRDVVTAHLAEHKAWLREHADQGRILLSGPRPDGGAVIVTADLDEATVRDLIETDPWHRLGIASYERTSFEARTASPGVITAAEPDDSVVLINVATTEDAPATVDALAEAVRHVAATADGFRGSRLLTGVDGDAVVNLASWSDEKRFRAIFDDPEFTRRYEDFARTTTGAKYRLYRTSRVITPNR